MAAACGSLKHIFETPLPEKNQSSLIASLSSWKQQITPPPADHHSFTELFGEFHYKDNTQLFSSPSSSSSPVLNNGVENPKPRISSYNLGSNPTTNNSTIDKTTTKISPMNSNSLELCTEGLGSESLDDTEYSNKGRKDILTTNVSSMETLGVNESCSTSAAAHHTLVGIHHHPHQYRRSSRSSCAGRTTAFPPPISCIGRSGKPWVHFKSYRQDGRFVLQEVRIPTQEFLHASREDGRLRLRFFQPESDLTDGEEVEEGKDVGDREEVICEEEEEEERGDLNEDC